MTRKTAYNSRLPQWGLTWLNQMQCLHQHLCLVDIEVLRNPPLRQAAKRSGEIPSGSRQIALEALPSEALSGTSHIRRFCKMQNTSQSLQCVSGKCKND